MVKADFRVCIDACVLANFAVADLLLRLARRPRQLIPVWSDRILEETYRTHVHKLKWGKDRAASFRRVLRDHYPEAMCTGYEQLIPAMTNHEKDRHVLAAAVKGEASLILTFNLKDFRDEDLSPWAIKARSPDDYLTTLYEMDSVPIAQTLGLIEECRRARGDTLEDVIFKLGQALPRLAAHLYDDLTWADSNGSPHSRHLHGQPRAWPLLRS